VFDFFDTGIIIGSSYIRNIDYEDFNPKEIDSNSEICFKRFSKNKNKIICTTVLYELHNIKELRKIMHKIVLLQLKGADEDMITNEYLNLANLRVHERDLSWLSDMAIKLKKYDVGEVYHMMEEIRNIFELNILSIIDGIELFKPTEKQKELRSKIKEKVHSLPEKPNKNDITILANAIICHNNKNLNFVTADKGFKKMNHSKLAKELKSLKLISEYPKIEVIIG